MPVFERGSSIFVSCQIGAEPALKKELAREHPELKFAYSRPGFVTFKVAEKLLAPNFELRSVFARAYGLSLAKFGPKEGTPQEKGRRILELAQQESDPTLNIHVWERDRFAPGEEPPGFIPGEWAESAIKMIPVARINQRPDSGKKVLDVILVEEAEWWLGLHQHTPGRSPSPGGNPKIELPSQAPSRAYIKLEESLLWSGVRLQKGDQAVEVGSAPGGASYALLQRGLSVIGIDPGNMAPQVLESKKFRHIASPVATVWKTELPQSVQWILLDMNVAHGVSLFAVDRLVGWFGDSLLGVLLTVKLNNWKMADQIPKMIEHVRSMGMSRVRATQLASNRQEIFIFGLTRKGLRRKS
jgi:23S rRNA (cytidine2498-2'-O)-methyltransferase